MRAADIGMLKVDRVVLGELIIFFQAEDGIRDLVRSRGLGDVYKRQVSSIAELPQDRIWVGRSSGIDMHNLRDGQLVQTAVSYTHLTLPTSDLV